MTDNYLYEQLDFDQNPIFEKIIEDLLKDKYSIIDSFFDASGVDILRSSLLEKYEEDKFKKAAIGNRVNESIIQSIRGDFIFWINENKTNKAENYFFDKINTLISYLNRTCFLGIL